jgi:hypothetical protein
MRQKARKSRKNVLSSVYVHPRYNLSLRLGVHLQAFQCRDYINMSIAHGHFSFPWLEAGLPNDDGMCTWS